MFEVKRFNATTAPEGVGGEDESPLSEQLRSNYNTGVEGLVLTGIGRELGIDREAAVVLNSPAVHPGVFQVMTALRAFVPHGAGERVEVPFPSRLGDFARIPLEPLEAQGLQEAASRRRRSRSMSARSYVP